MNESMADLLRQGAETVERPNLDVGLLVANAERRLRRRRLAAVAASAVAVTLIVAGGVAFRPDEQGPSPAPPVKTPDPTPEPEAGPGSKIYFAAVPTRGDALTGRLGSLDGGLDIYRGGEPARRVISTEANERCPAVSPDGANLAYLSLPSDVDGPTAADVVVVPLDPAGDPDTGSRHVVLRDAVGSCPQWSPDGRWLAVVADGQPSEVTEPPDELRVVALGGQERVLALVPGANGGGAFAWSPDGDVIAYLTQDAVWIAPLDGGEPELLWRGTATPDPSPYGLPLLGAPQSLAWLGGSELAVSVFAGFTDTGQDEVLHIVDADSGQARTLDDISGYAGGGTWSPDGSRLAFQDGPDGRIRVYDRANGSTTTVRPQLADVSEPVFTGVWWSPDGDRLLSVASRRPASRGDAFALVSMATDGTSVEVLTSWTNALYWTGLSEYPTWRRDS